MGGPFVLFFLSHSRYVLSVFSPVLLSLKFLPQSFGCLTCCFIFSSHIHTCMLGNRVFNSDGCVSNSHCLKRKCSLMKGSHVFVYTSYCMKSNYKLDVKFVCHILHVCLSIQCSMCLSSCNSDILFCQH